MEGPLSRHVADRDLRHLATEELLKLIREDIRELDTLIAARRPAPKLQEKKHKTAKAAMDEVLDDVETVPLHSVSCCNHAMGSFPPWARVRCPFCSEWHRAGDYPLA